MSEQDFFFDEEPDAKAPASKGSGPASKGSKPAPAATATAGSKAAPVVEAAPSVADQSTTWAVASLLGVIGLLLGAILGYMLGTSVAGTTSITTPPAAAPAALDGSGTAPSTLTSDQINAPLPPGHPPIDASGTPDTTTGP